MWIVYSLIIGVVVVGSKELIQYLWMCHKYPYRWTCPTCGFELHTDNKYSFDISKSSHNHSSLYEFKDTDPWNSPETKAACQRFHPGEPCMPGENHPGEAARRK